MDISIVGLTDLMAKIEGYPNIVRELNQESLMKGAKIVQEKASELAPKSKNHNKSGPKRKGQARQIPAEHISNAIPIGKIKNPKGNQSIDVGWKLKDTSEYFYAKFVEYGTSKMPPRPFLKQAMEDSEEEIVASFSSNIQRGLENI